MIKYIQFYFQKYFQTYTLFTGAKIIWIAI